MDESDDDDYKESDGDDDGSFEGNGDDDPELKARMMTATKPSEAIVDNYCSDCDLQAANGIGIRPTY